MKKIYLDFDDTLVHYGNYLFKDINQQLVKEESFNEVKINKFHVSKATIKTFMGISGDSGVKLIQKILDDINSHFEIEKDKLITLDNMNRRHQKMKAFFKEFPDREDDILKKMNSFFIDKKSYKQVSLGNVSKMEEELSNFYQGSKLGYYENAKIFSKMFEFLNTLKSEGYSIEIVTSSMSDDQRDWKTEWIKENLGDLISNIIYANQKHKYTTNGVFIDDKMKHVKGHVENSEHIGILFNPHNLDVGDNPGIYVCNNYDEVFKVLGIPSNDRSKGREI